MLTPLTPAEAVAVLVRSVDRLRELGVSEETATYTAAHQHGVDSLKARLVYRAAKAHELREAA